MGLTISYTLSSQRRLPEPVVWRLVERTAKFAEKIGCPGVDGPILGGPDHWKMWKLPDGATTGEPVSAIKGYSVNVWPGEGCETAWFGLCRYPGVRGWRLTSWCKTQYAARHGVHHFLRCHRRIISLLDLWRSFGVDLEVCDEGEYWQTRSLDRLRQRLGTYDRMIAAFAGAMKDAAGDDGPPVTAEIFDDARFEQLEAEGRAEFGIQLNQVEAELRRKGIIR